MRTVTCLGALAGLLLILLVRQRMKPVGFEDYSVYYLGGTMALQGEWHDLYPVPLPGAQSHPGWPSGSTMKPAYRRAAASMGQPEPYRYIYPPPSALLVAPVSLLNGRAALWCWWGLSSLSCWVSGLLTAAIYRMLTGRRERVWTLLIVGVTCCPLTWATVRVGNTSAIGGAMIGIVLWGWCTANDVSSALALYVGGALKFATLPLALIPALLRRTRTVLTCAVAAAALTAAVIAVSGSDPWLEYLQIAGSLSRPNDWVINLSIHGLIARLFPQSIASIEWWLQLVTWCTLGLIAIGLHRCAWRDTAAEPVLAGASALVAWLLIFEPTTQNHYFVYFYPLWGYYLAESRGSAFGKLAAFCVIAGTMLPIGGSNRSLPVALHFHQLGAAVVALVFGTVRLYQLGSNTVDRDGGRPIDCDPAGVLAGGVHRETGGRVPAIG